MAYYCHNHNSIKNRCKESKIKNCRHRKCCFLRQSECSLGLDLFEEYGIAIFTARGTKMVNLLIYVSEIFPFQNKNELEAFDQF